MAGDSGTPWFKSISQKRWQCSVSQTIQGHPCGWFCEAVLEKWTTIGKITTFNVFAGKTKSRWEVGSSHEGAHKVDRLKMWKRRRDILPASKSRGDHSKHFNAANQNDCDSADTVSILTNWFYFRIDFWLKGKMVHIMYVVLRGW